MGEEERWVGRWSRWLGEVGQLEATTTYTFFGRSICDAGVGGQPRSRHVARLTETVKQRPRPEKFARTV